MTITPAQLKEMCELHETCCCATGKQWEIAAARLRELEIETGYDIPLHSQDLAEWTLNRIFDMEVA